MNALRLSLALSALALGLVITEVASAGVTITAGPGGGNPAENITFNQAGLTSPVNYIGPANTIFGATNQTSTTLSIFSSSTIIAAPGIGQAMVQSPGGAFGDVLFTPGGSLGGLFNTFTSFTDFKFNIDAASPGGLAHISVNGGTPEDFLLNQNGQNFFRITADGLSVIMSVLVTTDGSLISDIKQIRVGGLTAPPGAPPLVTPVEEPDLHPEPASILAWGLVAAVGAVATRLRRRSAKAS